MLGITHALVGLLIATGVYQYLGGSGAAVADPLPLLAFALLGALLPDVDFVGSALGRKVKPLGKFLKHRGVTHSLFAAVLLTVALSFFLEPLLPILFLLGYLSHLVLDASTAGGVRAFWPSKLMLRSKGKTGAPWEILVDGGLIILLVILWI